MYFLGVTTGASFIHKIFPRWAELAGIGEASLAGIDIAPGAAPERYRAAVATIRDDPQALGALVTTHKVALYAHARDLFTAFNAEAEELGEVGCIVRRGERLEGIGIDTLTGGLALRSIVGEGPFRGQALILGAGGAGVALAVHLRREHRPAGVILTDVATERLDRARRLVAARYELASENDRLIEALPAGSLVVNATGMGKDRPGCPIRAATRFPAGAVAWDFNYRGELLFLEYAGAQGARAVDGWEYFLHGWSQIMARVFGFGLTASLYQGFAAEARRRRERQ
jgi:shikimate 5-dehydrogenase